MNFERHNKGFTIIELVVVMVIIGILVLLVVPNMMGDTEEAKIARIKNDIKVVEGEVETYVMNGNPVPAYKDITTDIPTYVANEKLYDLSGSIVDVVAVTDHMYFRVVSGKFIEDNVDTKLDGVFLVTEKMKFFYLDVEMEAPDTPMVTGNPIITANPFTWTKDDVNITIVYPTSSVTNEYSIDGITWSGYSAPFKVSDNGLIYAKGTDDTGVETDVATLDIDYIDRVDPELVLAPDITTTTSGDVTISVQANDAHSGISNIKLPDDSYIYVENGSYTATINGVYEFQTTDRAGNTTIKSIDIGNINKVLPVITTVTTPSTPTNGTVVVTATTDKGTLNETSHTFMDNGSFTFIATDEYGNTASETVIVDNIDRIPPELTLTPNITTPTNGDVIITVEATDVWSGIDFITLPNDSTESTDATTYTVSSNGPYTFKATDLAGNETSQPMEIVNIGVTAPVVTIDPYITTPTNQDIIVTASTDKGTLNATSHTFTSNGSFTFTATDEHGLSGSVTVTIGNIDKTPPVITTAISTEEPTNQDVIVTASVNEGTLNETSHTFISNDSFTFTAIDSAGNSSSKIVTITNIDRTLPTVQFTPNGGTVAKAHATVVSVTDAGGIASLQYEWTNSPTFPSPGVWNTFNSGATLVTPASQNGNYYLHIKAVDTAGNERNASSNAFLLDNIAPNAPTLSEVDGTVTITYSVDTTNKQYKIGSGSWTTYINPVNMTVSGTIYARGADEAGNYSNESSLLVTIGSLVCELPETLGYEIKSATYTSLIDGTVYTGVEIFKYNGTDTDVAIPSEFAFDDGSGMKCHPVIGITNNAFHNKALTSVIIPEGVRYLGNNSFHGLDEVVGAFEGNNLISINIPSTVEKIGNNAFHNNYMEEVVFPDSVVDIGNNAFHNNNLKALYFGTELTTVGSGAFASNSLSPTYGPNNLSGVLFKSNPAIGSDAINNGVKFAYDGSGAYVEDSKSGIWRKGWTVAFDGANTETFKDIIETSVGNFIAVGDSSSIDGDMDGLNKGDYDAIIVGYDALGLKQWTEVFGGSGADYYNSIAATNDGGYVVAGYSNSVDGDLTGLNKGDYDAVIVKYDASHNIEWKQSFGGASDDEFKCVELASDGGYVAVGFSNSVDGNLSGLNMGDYDAVVVKYDSLGNLQWTKVFGGSLADEFHSVSISNDNGFLVVGNSNSTDIDMTGLSKGNKDGVIVKYDSVGNKEWAEVYGNASYLEWISSVTETADGGFVIAGNRLEGISYKAFIAKYDVIRNMEWENIYGSEIFNSDAQYFNSVVQTNSGDYLVTGGYIAGSLMYGTRHGLIGRFNSLGEKIWMDLNHKGNHYEIKEANDEGLIIVGGSDGQAIVKRKYPPYYTEWTKQFVTTNGTITKLTDINQVSDGGYIAVGYSDATDGEMSGISKGYGRDGFIIKYDSFFNKEWIRSFGGNGDDYFYAVAETADGGYAVAGHTNSSDGDMLNLSKGYKDGFVVKYSSTGNVEWTTILAGSEDEEIHSLEVTVDGIIVIGESKSTDGTFKGYISKNKLYDAILVKLDLSGNIVLIDVFSGANNDRYYSVAKTNDGGCIVAGSSNSTDGDMSGLNKGDYDGIIVKYDSLFNREWIKSFGGSDGFAFEEFTDLAITNDGGFIAGGKFDSTDGDLSGVEPYALIVKFDSLGSIQWIKGVNGNDDMIPGSLDVFSSVLEDANGNIIVVGTIGIPGEDIFDTTYESVMTKYTSSGDALWIKYGLVSFSSMSKTNDGGFIGVMGSIIGKFDSSGNIE